MQTRSISVTEAARNFSDCVNRARYQGVTFILHRNGVPVARIVPESPKRSSEAGQVLKTGAEPAAESGLATRSEFPLSLW